MKPSFRISGPTARDGAYSDGMNAQAATRFDENVDDSLLDVDTSAAILRWMETAAIPDGVNADEWDRWVDSGCQGSLYVSGMPVTSDMLGKWARSGALL